MSTTPHVSLHLVREIMRMIHFLSNGDTIIHLALAGKGHLGIFKYIAETHYIGILEGGEVKVTINNRGYPSHFVRNAVLQCLVRRYLQSLVHRDLQQLNVDMSFILENITKLVAIRIDVQLLNSLPNLETLVVYDSMFFQYIKTSALYLKNLSCLTLKVGWCDEIPDKEILKMLPLLQDNVLQHVKHLEIEIGLIEGTPLDDFLTYLSAVLHCFPSVEASSLLVDYLDQERPPLLKIHISTKFIEWLEKLEVHGNFTMTYREKYLGVNTENLAAFRDEVKSVGMAKTDDEEKFVMVKTFRSVKFIHYVYWGFSRFR